MTDQEKITAALAQFPKRFGLRGFPGDVFRCSETHSYVSEAGGEVTVYLERLAPQLESHWLPFSKGSVAEIQRELVRI